MKKIMLFILVAVLSVSIVATFSLISCKEEAAPEVEEVVGGEAKEIALEVWDFQGDFYTEFWDEVVNGYNEANPNLSISIVRKQFTIDDFNTALKGAFASNEPPDLFEIHPGTQSIELVSAGQLADFTDIILNDAEWSEWIGPALELKDSYVDGKIYGIPLNVNNLAIVYWKTLFDEKGLEFPTTIDELKQVGETFKADGYRILGAGFKDTWSMKDMWVALVRSGDESGDLIERANKGEASWKDPLFKKALEAMVDLKDSGILPENVLELGLQDEIIAMGNKESIMVYPLPTGAQFLFEDSSIYPDLGLAPMPRLDKNGTSMLTGGPGVVIGLSPQTDEEKKAIIVDLLKFVNSAYGQELMYDFAQTPPGNLVQKESPDPLFEKFTYNQNNMPVGYRYIDNAELNSAIENGIAKALLGIDVDTILEEIETLSQQVNS